jgi:RHS repeat-associated protein
VKYYGGLGSAMRSSGAGGGAGTLRYLLPDHLGSASTVLDTGGSVVSAAKYWPYGTTRSGSVTQTDKLFTGQQQEPGSDVLGLYNYKARFYSTVTGRFLSADPLVTDGLNRYTYVGNNPLARVDPSGLFFLMSCGFGATCEWGNIDSYEAHVKSYWALEHGKTQAEQNWLWALMKWTWAAGDVERVKAFDVAFFDSSPFVRDPNETNAVWRLYEHVERLQDATGQPLTYAFGHSYGGLVLHDFVAGSRVGAFGDDILYGLRGIIINAAPKHSLASVSIPTQYEGVDLFEFNGHDMSGFDFNISVVTHGGAEGAHWAGRLANFFGVNVSLTVPGAINLPASPGAHADSGASTIYNDLERLQYEWIISQ